jgi:quercetin dioxygenase-like cupin family protein
MMPPEARQAMALQVRRVVTGHDAAGRAGVLSDGALTNVTSRRSAHEAAVIWTTQGYPVSNDGSDDPSAREIGSTVKDGTVFRVVYYGPGCAPRRHRTDSIDYAVVMSGEIDMELDGGETVHLRAGDVLVQRGTVHNWVNHGAEACVIAFVLIDAKPVEAGGRTLRAEG